MQEETTGPKEAVIQAVPEEKTPENPEKEAAAPLGTKKEPWLTMPLAIVIAGVVIACAIVLVRTPAPTTAAADAVGAGGVGQGTITAATLRPASATDHILGNPNAPIVIVEFADFQCPYCSLIYPSLKKVVDDSKGQVAWVFRNFPLDSIHPNARPAAEAAECIAALKGNDAYWEFMDDDFNNQQNIGDAFYKAEAAKLGVDVTAFNSCVANKTYDSRINTDEAEAVENGGNGTPFTIVVPKGGKAFSFSGALPYSEINAVVMSALSKVTAQPSS